MSTKTITKRIALATVVALGAGVLSLVSVSSANAAATQVNTALGNTSAIAGSLYVAGTVSTTAVSGTASTTTASNTSTGLLSVSDIAGNLVAGTTQTATLLANGNITVYTSLAANAGTDAVNQAAVLKVTGGTITSTVAPSANFIAYGSGLTTAAVENMATGGTGVVAWVVAPNTGASTMTINMYNGSAGGTSSTWSLAASSAGAQAAAGSPTLGTLNGSIVVSIASASTAGVLSLSKSGIYYQDGAAAHAAATSDNTSQLTTPGISAYNVPQYAAVRVRDAYSTSITSGFLTASATNGAYVSFSKSSATPASLSADTAASTSAGTSSSTYFSTMIDQAWLTVLPSTNAATNTTVTISYNGTVLGTKAFTFTGDVAKVVLSSSYNGTTLQSTKAYGNYVTIAFQDSAGNAIYPGTVASSYPAVVTKNAGTAGTGIGLGTVVQPTSSAAGYAQYSCGSVNVTGQLQVDYSNLDGVVVTSNAIPVSCAGGPATYSAKLDKAKYAPGDIAILTVTFKDSTGALAADQASSASTGVGIADSTTAPTLTGSQMNPISAATAQDKSQGGVAIYKFTVGTTSGSFNMVVDFPHVDAVLGAAQTVAYTVSDGSTSLNDVLKGIVSLIASINKQIAALAKLVTKK